MILRSKPVVLSISRLLVLLSAWFVTAVQAHFQTLIPSNDIVDRPGQRQLELALSFTHPMLGGPLMQLEAPRRFGVLGPMGEKDLRQHLEPLTQGGITRYRASYTLPAPGNYIFFVEPEPYWEAAEGKMISHYTKVVVDGFGYLSGWGRLVDFPVEIEPLVRPYGLWTGNLFRGRVLQNGQPLPFAEIEVEWLNDGSVTVPADAYITQVIKADSNGVFSYAMPRAGLVGVCRTGGR